MLRKREEIATSASSSSTWEDVVDAAEALPSSSCHRTESEEIDDDCYDDECAVRKRL